jgi:hypothetical protein
MGSFRSRVVARKKLEAMVRGAAIVRAELTGEQLEDVPAMATQPSGTTSWGQS